MRYWGSDCTECGNATPGTNRCDECGSNEHTVALWREDSQSDCVMVDVVEIERLPLPSEAT